MDAVRFEWNFALVRLRIDGRRHGTGPKEALGVRLAVVSNIEHYRTGGGLLCASAAVAREVDALAGLYDEVVHVACLRAGDAPPQAQSYRAPNIRLLLLPPAGGRGAAGKLDALIALPGRLAAVHRAWRGADAAIVRCPSNVAAAALALVAAGLRPARVWIKYTGPWQGRPDEATGYRMQRLWLRSGLSGGVVSVGGLDAAPGGGACTVCNPSLSLMDVREGDLATRGKLSEQPWRLLAVGRLVEDKGFDVAVRALARVGPEATLDIVGDGPARPALEALAVVLGVASRVRFHGWLASDRLEPLYRGAHVLLAPSWAEGWSRAWTEAAARRCVPFASRVGAARGLEQAGAGVVLASRDPAEWAGRIRALLEAPSRWRAVADRGPKIARLFTYERFQEQARSILLPDAASREEGLEPT
jgi:glycosyltransferase involved in cell wall biosynthesis